jgi:multicomponent Na+:H+ antiporter subunit B
MKGMTFIVRTVTSLVAALIAVFGIYTVLYGHLSPGGGFPGGVILGCGLILLCLAFGREFVEELIGDRTATIFDCVGALAFLFIGTALGYYGGAFFYNVLFTGGPSFLLTDGGTIMPCNVAIGIKVGACLFGVFLALAVFRPGGRTT